MKKILVVAAHPDDEVLGCGASIAKWVRNGAQVDVLILCENNYRHGVKDAVALQQCFKAQARLGYRTLYKNWYKDQCLDEVPFKKLVGVVEEALRRDMYDLVLTHAGTDLNRDHRLTYEAVMVAARTPRHLSSIWSFYVPSASDQAGYGAFKADIHHVVSLEDIKAKVEALACYEQEAQDAPHPRSPGAVGIAMAYYGSQIGVDAAEQFSAVRLIEK